MTKLTPCPFCPIDSPISQRTNRNGRSSTQCNTCLCTKLSNEWETRPIEDELTAENKSLKLIREILLTANDREKAKLEKAKEALKEISTGKGRSGTPNHEAVTAVQALKDIEGEG